MFFFVFSRCLSLSLSHSSLGRRSDDNSKKKKRNSDQIQYGNGHLLFMYFFVFFFCSIFVLHSHRRHVTWLLCFFFPSQFHSCIFISLLLLDCQYCNTIDKLVSGKFDITAYYATHKNASRCIGKIYARFQSA